MFAPCRAINRRKKEWCGSALGSSPRHSVNLNMIRVSITAIAIIGDQELGHFLRENRNEIIGGVFD